MGVHGIGSFPEESSEKVCFRDNYKGDREVTIKGIPKNRPSKLFPVRIFGNRFLALSVPFSDYSSVKVFFRENIRKQAPRPFCTVFRLFFGKGMLP